MKAIILFVFMLAGLLAGCSTASRLASRHVYGPADVAAREAQYERLLAEFEHSLEPAAFGQMRASWQQLLKAEAELQRIFAESGIIMDSDYYKLKCEYLDAITELLRMVKADSQPNQPVAGNAGFASQFQFGHHWPGVPDPDRWAYMARLFTRQVSATLLCAMLCGCGKARHAERDIVPSLVSSLPTADGQPVKDSTNRFACRWDTYRHKAATVFLVENNLQNWLFTTQFIAGAYQSAPRLHSHQNQTNEAIFYGVGYVPAITAITRQSERGTQYFSVTIETVSDLRRTFGKELVK